MLRYKLRTLMMVLALGPIILWVAWWLWSELGPQLGFFDPKFVDYGDGRGPHPANTASTDNRP